MSEPRTSPFFPIVTGALMALGAALSAYYLYHLWIPAGDSLCTVSERINCTTSAMSPWAYVGGTPIALLGLGFYVGAFHLLRTPASGDVGHAKTLLVLLTGASVYSVVLAAVSAFQLKTLCPVCAGMYLCNWGGLAVVWAWVRIPPHVALYRQLLELKETFLQGGLWFLVFFAAIVGVGITAEDTVTGTNVEIEPVDPTMGPIAYAELTAPHVSARGPVDAPVVIVEWSDFQCPYCQRLAGSLERMHEVFGDRIRIEFRHLPLDAHEHARAAALAAICAGQVDRFWPMHDALFAQQDRLSADFILQIGESVGLDPQALATCMADPATLAVLNIDMEAGRAQGARGTPTFFVNGIRYAGGYPAGAMENLIRYYMPDHLE